MLPFDSALIASFYSPCLLGESTVYDLSYTYAGTNERVDERGERELHVRVDVSIFVALLC